MAQHEGRTAIVRRLAALLLYTCTARHRPTVKTMARGLGVSERTVSRDLAALDDAGWPYCRLTEEDGIERSRRLRCPA